MVKLNLQDNEEVEIIGEINAANANNLVIQFAKLEIRNKVVDINCQQIESAKSIALAVLLEMIKISNKKKQKVNFKNVPKSLVKISEISHLEAYFQ